MRSEAEALEHTKKRDTGHQSVALDNEIGVSTMLKMGDSTKVVIKQDMKGRENKYGEILILGTDVVQDVTTSRFRTCRLYMTV